MKLVSKVTIICTIFYGCGGSPTETGGGQGGDNSSSAENSSSTGTVCIPKDCQALSEELSKKANLNTIHNACGIIGDGCGHVVDCGNVCRNLQETCKGTAPNSDLSWDPEGGIERLCGGGCVQYTGISTCPVDFSIRVACTDKATNQQSATLPAGYSECVFQSFGASYPLDGVSLVKWCCKQ